MAVWWVDKTSGDDTNSGQFKTEPFETIEAAASAVGVKDTVRVFNTSGTTDTYDEAVFCSVSGVRFIADGPDLVKIAPTGAGEVAMRLDGDNQFASGFHFAPASTGAGYGLYLTDPGITCEDCWITSLSSHAVVIIGADRATVRRCLIYDGTDGINFQAVVDILIEDNTIYNSSDNGIDNVLAGGDRAVIRNNRIHSNSDRGIVLKSSDAVLEGNVFWNNTVGDVDITGATRTQIRGGLITTGSGTLGTDVVTADSVEAAAVTKIVASVVALIGTPAGADTAADIAAITALLGTPAGADLAADIAAAATASDLTTALTEVTAATDVPATPTMRQALTLLYMMARNELKATNSPGQREIYNDAGTLVLKGALTELADEKGQGKLVDP